MARARTSSAFQHTALGDPERDERSLVAVVDGMRAGRRRSHVSKSAWASGSVSASEFSKIAIGWFLSSLPSTRRFSVDGWFSRK
jgi:hypothetical protein